MDSMTLIAIAAGVAALFTGVVIGLFIIRRRPRKRPVKTDRFTEQWMALQKLCRTKETWPDALLEADKLLDKALKKRRFRGKRMGERLTSAQRFITDNDDIWDAHNLVKKLVEADGNLPLREKQVKEALISFKLALVDLGALPGKNHEPTTKNQGS